MTELEPKPALSVVAPFFNEGPNVAEFHEALARALEPLGRTWEAIYIDDGSRDDTGRLLDEIAAREPRVTVIHFRRNFGQTAALSAGFEHARGAVLVPIDSDLQNDPADIGRLLAKLDEGFDVVSGWRKDRKDPLSKRVPSRFANAVISRVSGVHLHDYGCSLKAYRREVLEGVILYGEMHRFIPIYAHFRGARVAELPVTHRARTRGKSNYGLERTIKVLLDLIVMKFFGSYMTKPIYVFGGFGLVSLLVGTAAAALAVFFKLVPKDNPWGDPQLHKDFIQTPLPVIAAVLAMLGVVMVLQGLVAEMVMRTYYESQGRRPYAIRDVKSSRARSTRVRDPDDAAV
jgi:glycosyltransferase involved in cell wall biosynthesis